MAKLGVAIETFGFRVGVDRLPCIFAVSCLSIFRGRSAEVYGRRGGWMFFA